MDSCLRRNDKKNVPRKLGTFALLNWKIIFWGGIPPFGGTNSTINLSCPPCGTKVGFHLVRPHILFTVSDGLLDTVGLQQLEQGIVKNVIVDFTVTVNVIFFVDNSIEPSCIQQHIK